jgi:NADPH-dependent 2,4-dienoyl-CoA reductase/sulfur reductase-like enzyme/serine/threonine protein kinase
VQIVAVEDIPQHGISELHQQLARLAPAPLLEARAEFDGYRIVREIHASARSHIYLALDLQTEALVALKTPSTDLQGDRDHLERFLMEEWIARRVNSPHVLKPYPRTRERRFLHVAMEYLEGQTLAQWMTDNPRPELEKGTRHRRADRARPAGLPPDGNAAPGPPAAEHHDRRTGTVKIIDFGSARSGGRERARRAARALEHPRALQYTAPEYFVGDPGTESSDLYSLGVIAYHMLSGRLPYGAEAARVRTREAQRRLQYETLLDEQRDIPRMDRRCAAKGGASGPARALRVALRVRARPAPSELGAAAARCRSSSAIRPSSGKGSPLPSAWRSSCSCSCTSAWLVERSPAHMPVASQAMTRVAARPEAAPEAPPRRLVVIGNGMAAARVLEELLKLEPCAYHITVFGAEPHPNYNRILLSAVLAGDTGFDEIIDKDAAWYLTRGIELRSGLRVTRIDRARRRVIAADGSETPYDRLLMATGSQPVLPSLPGTDLAGVITYRDIADTQSMIGASGRVRDAVVIGGGLLGLEAANGLSQRGMRVTVVHLMPSLMERQLDAPAARVLQTSLEARGIRFILGAQTREIVGYGGAARAVRLEGGREIPASLVVFAVGIRPNVELRACGGALLRARRAGIGHHADLRPAYLCGWRMRCPPRRLLRTGCAALRHGAHLRAAPRRRGPVRVPRVHTGYTAQGDGHRGILGRRILGRDRHRGHRVRGSAERHLSQARPAGWPRGGRRDGREYRGCRVVPGSHRIASRRQRLAGPSHLRARARRGCVKIKSSQPRKHTVARVFPS